MFRLFSPFYPPYDLAFCPNPQPTMSTCILYLRYRLCPQDYRATNAFPPANEAHSLVSSYSAQAFPLQQSVLSGHMKPEERGITPERTLPAFPSRNFGFRGILTRGKARSNGPFLLYITKTMPHALGRTSVGGFHLTPPSASLSCPANTKLLALSHSSGPSITS